MTGRGRPRNGDGRIDAGVGRRIRQHRIRLGVSQEALAKALKVSFQQVQKYESGANSIPTGRLLTLCEVFGIMPNDLYGWTMQQVPDDISSTAYKTAYVIERLPPHQRQALLVLARNLLGYKKE